jgi:hypothetical protein
MNFLKRVMAPVFRDKRSPFSRQASTWEPLPGAQLVDVRGEDRTTISGMLTNEKSVRAVLKTAALTANLDRQLTAVLVNVAGAALQDRLKADMPAIESATAAILKDDPTARIELHVEIPTTRPDRPDVVLVFHLDTCARM